MKRAGIQEALGLRHEDSYGLCIWPVPQICPEYSNSRNKNGLACASKHNLAVFPPCLLGGGLFRNAWQTIMLPDSDAVIAYSDYRNVGGTFPFWYPFKIRVIYRGNSLELEMSRVSLKHS